MIGFSVEREACEWAVGMCVYVSVFVLYACMFVCEVEACMPWQEEGATAEQCPCNVSDE